MLFCTIAPADAFVELIVLFGLSLTYNGAPPPLALTRSATVPVLFSISRPRVLLSAWLSVTCAALLFSILIAVVKLSIVHPMMLTFSRLLIVTPVPVSVPVSVLPVPSVSQWSVIPSVANVSPSVPAQYSGPVIVEFRVRLAVQLTACLLLIRSMLAMLSPVTVLLMIVLLEIVEPVTCESLAVVPFVRFE